MKLTFLGATHEVTGSCTLIENNGHYGLVDCGMEQGENIFKNQEIPVNPGIIDYVLLTHAHIDHSGLLPLLYKNGFSGTIYATVATCDLCSIMLRDSAHIQMMEAEWRTRKSKRAGGQDREPLYDIDDANGAISKLRRCEYGETVQVADGVMARFTDVGHLLGSSCIEVWLTEGDVSRKLVFSGDVGNTNQPIIRNPSTVEEADYVVIESTYGDRLHESTGSNNVDFLADCIQRTLDRGGNVVIPSFAVGRTQEMLYFIRDIKTRGLVTGHDNFPVYVDSPLAIEATGIFLQTSKDDFDDETRALVDQGINPLMFPNLHTSVSADESRAINDDKQPKVIIAASGMCEAGRIRHHLKHNLWRKESMVLFVGYQAAGTLGRIIHDGAKQVTLFGEKIAVKAEIAVLAGKSGHADQKGLLNWLGGFKQKPRLVFVNHGENEVCDSFVKLLEEEHGHKAFAPYSGTEFDLKEEAFLACPEGVPIEQESDGRARANEIYDRLNKSLEKVSAKVRQSKDLSNKELSKMVDQLEMLLSKWQ
ncbi:MAG: MBL fold metallo-hydrolase [Eubacteriales bacterium]|nr:MBL fold metallo-hydrolase [Eubacteriales bacterium]